MTFPRFSGLAVGLKPEPDYNTSLPIICHNHDIIRHLSVQVRGDTVWIYTGSSDVSIDRAIDTIQDSELSTEEAIAQLNDMQRFFYDFNLDWADLKEGEVGLSLALSCGIVDSVPYSEFDRKIDLLRDFCRQRNYLGFKPEILKKHPEQDFRLQRVYKD